MADDRWDIDLDNCTPQELDQAWMSLAHARKYVVEIMGFSEHDLRAGLVAGVIRSTGTSDGRGGYRQVEVQVGGLVKWLALLKARQSVRQP